MLMAVAETATLGMFWAAFCASGPNPLLNAAWAISFPLAPKRKAEMSCPSWINDEKVFERKALARKPFPACVRF